MREKEEGKEGEEELFSGSIIMLLRITLRFRAFEAKEIGFWQRNRMKR